MKNGLLLIILLFLSGCSVKPAPLANIDNISMPSPWSKHKSFTLENGSYGEDAAADSAGQVTIHSSEYFGRGIIDDQEVLAAIFITQPGGKEPIYDLFLFTEKDNILQYAAQTPLGEKIQINQVGVADNMIKVSISTPPPETTMGAEPDLPLIKSFLFTDQQLIEPCKPKATPAAAALPPAILAGKTFYWQSTLYGNDTQETPGNPAAYSIKFNNDWTLEIHSDCNETGGFFGVNGSQLTIRPDPAVDRCSANSLSGVFLKDLSDAVSFIFQEKSLYIELIYDSGTLILTNQP